jgi:hypothetical protein
MKLKCFWLRLIAEEVLEVHFSDERGNSVSNICRFNLKPKCMAEFFCGK